MKTTLRALLVFIISFIFLVFLSATLYYLYYNAHHVVAGAPASLQPFLLFYEGVLAVWDSCFVVALSMVLFYYVRTRQRTVPSFLMWLVLCIFVFAIVQPFSFLLLKNFSLSLHESSVSNRATENILTPNVFRAEVVFDQAHISSKDSVLFLTKVDKNSKQASGVLFSVPFGFSSLMEQELISDSKRLYEQVSKVQDPLIVGAISQPFVFTLFFSEVSTLKTKYLNTVMQAKNFMSFDFISQYIGYASIGLAFCGLFALVTASSWKLFNMLYIIVASFTILHVNYWFQCVFDMQILIRALTDMPFAFPQWLYPVIINVLGAIFFLIIGLCTRKPAEITPTEEYDI